MGLNVCCRGNVPYEFRLFTYRRRLWHVSVLEKGWPVDHARVVLRWDIYPNNKLHDLNVSCMYACMHAYAFMYACILFSAMRILSVLTVSRTSLCASSSSMASSTGNSLCAVQSLRRLTSVQAIHRRRTDLCAALSLSRSTPPSSMRQLTRSKGVLSFSVDGVRCSLPDLHRV